MSIIDIEENKSASPEETENARLERLVEERKLRNQGAIALLRSWREDGDEQEQKETWEYLKKALDEDRLSNRPLFPEE